MSAVLCRWWAPLALRCASPLTGLASGTFETAVSVCHKPT
jgi:hypothetical protein